MLNTNERLLIAKFSKSNDLLHIGIWESITLTIARQAGLTMASLRTQKVDVRTVFLSECFDRDSAQRISFLSAMFITVHKDGDGTGSYIEIAAALTRQGAHAGRERTRNCFGAWPSRSWYPTPTITCATMDSGEPKRLNKATNLRKSKK